LQGELKLRQKVLLVGGKPMKSSGDDGQSKPLEAETALVTPGRDTRAQKGFVNPPVVHGSTVLYPTADDLHAHRGEFQYRRHGAPTIKALREALMTLEGPACAGVGLAPSGLAAISTALLAVLKAGDHLPVCDNAYRPARNFCNGMLARCGIETGCFDPLIGADIAKLFQPNTRAVLVEAPGSQSFEMPDLPAIAAVARARRSDDRRQHLGDAGLHRRVRPVQHCTEASAAAGRRRIARYRHAIRHGAIHGEVLKAW
jgi:cystathionine beta-lyase